MEINLSTFFLNNWEALATLSIATIATYITFIKTKKKNKPAVILQPNNTNNSNITNTNAVNISLPFAKKFENDEDDVQDHDKHYKIDAAKSKIRILFIDDDKKFNVVKILKDSGWKNTKAVTDIKSLDIPIVKETDIFFVDINGVGKLLNCEYEGLDIALMLKQKYPDKKVIIYSANKKYNAFHQAWDKCDFKLEKNALPYQFQGLVEEYSLKIYP